MGERKKEQLSEKELPRAHKKHGTAEKSLTSSAGPRMASHDIHEVYNVIVSDGYSDNARIH